MNGIINIYKERGYTSHDVVARLRGITGQRKMGHTGTLDPEAEGVLPVCLGTATKACDVLTDKSKCYEAVILLGVATDSQDTTGNVTEAAAPDVINALTDEEITEAIGSFVGEYDQLPPMFSAVRLGGQRLYEMARAGKDVEREKRHVVINSITKISDIRRMKLSELLCSADFEAGSALREHYEGGITEQGRFERYSRDITEQLDGDMPVIRVAVRVECSKGTYVRTICNDIGEKLGCNATMERLIRTRVSAFTADNALLLKEVEELAKAGTLEERIIPTDSCFTEYVRLDMKPKYDELLRNGNQLWFRHFSQYITEPPTPVRVYTSTGEFLGIYEYMDGRNKYTPVKVFKDD